MSQTMHRTHYKQEEQVFEAYGLGASLEIDDDENVTGKILIMMRTPNCPTYCYEVGTISDMRAIIAALNEKIEDLIKLNPAFAETAPSQQSSGEEVP